MSKIMSDQDCDLLSALWAMGLDTVNEDAGRFRAELAARGLRLAPIAESAPDGVGLDEPMRWLLRYVDASGGVIDAGEWTGNPLDLWCDDRGSGTDTFNLAIEGGYLLTSHDSDADNSSARLTDKGREALASKAPAPDGVGELVAALESVKRIADRLNDAERYTAQNAHADLTSIRSVVIMALASYRRKDAGNG